MILNIWQGNGVLVVVRERENLSHGEGEQLTTLIQRKEDVRDIMRSPDAVLNSLQQHATDSNYSYERLYRILYNKEMFLQAYQKIAPKSGNMTKGTDGKTIDGIAKRCNKYHKDLILIVGKTELSLKEVQDIYPCVKALYETDELHLPSAMVKATAKEDYQKQIKKILS